jgi:hypothetical protein
MADGDDNNECARTAQAWVPSPSKFTGQGLSSGAGWTAMASGQTGSKARLGHGMWQEGCASDVVKPTSEPVGVRANSVGSFVGGACRSGWHCGASAW